jgi:hypothetical protein
MKVILTILFFSSIAFAEQGKIIDIQRNQQDQVWTQYGMINGASFSTVTVEIAGEQYSAFYLSRRVEQLVVGDPIEAHVDGKHLQITDQRGKIQKAKIVRRAHDLGSNQGTATDTAQSALASAPPTAVPANAAEEISRTAQSVPATAPSEAVPASAVEGTTTVSVTAIPDGAEIYVDGTFVGSAPANLKLPAGKHMIRITQSAYKDWMREIGVRAASEAHIVATLEKK